MNDPIVIQSSPISAANYSTSDTEVNSDSDDIGSGELVPNPLESTCVQFSDSDDLPESQLSPIPKFAFTSEGERLAEVTKRPETKFSSQETMGATVETLTSIKKKDYNPYVIPLDSDSDDSDIDVPLNARIKRMLPKNVVFQSVKTLTAPPLKRAAAHDVSDVSSDGGYENHGPIVIGTESTSSQIKRGRSKSKRTNLEEGETKSDVREQKKLEKDREKLLKNVEKEAKKINKPGESVKLININLDRCLVEDPTTNAITDLLETNCLKYSVEPLAVKGCITWSREVIENHVLDDLQLRQNKQLVVEDEALILLKFPEFLQMVYSFKQNQQGMAFTPGANSLLDYTRTVQELLPEFNLTFVILGTEKYFRNKKNGKHREYKAVIRGEKPRRKNRQNLEISRIDMEEAMLEAQLKMKITFKFIETIDEIGGLLVMYTKAIAEAPYKREKQKQLGLSWYAQADGVGTVKVQKDGLGKLWIRQIMQFHQVSKETAIAIANCYPSPQALLEAYNGCGSIREAENLLSNIQVRRGVGPLTTNRRVGPELSYKLHTLFSALDGNTPLYRK